MQLPRRRRAALSDQPLIPLINVVFLLLIFFMLAGNVQPPHVLAVALPQTASGRDAAPAGVTLSVARGGALAWNGEPVTLAILRRRAAAWRRDRQPPPEIRLAADRAVALTALGPVLTALRDAGVTQVLWVSEAR